MPGSPLQGGMEWRGRCSLTAGGNPRLSSQPKPRPLAHVFIQIKGKKEKLMTEVVWGRESRVKRKREVEIGSSEGGVHSSVEFYNF